MKTIWSKGLLLLLVLSMLVGMLSACGNEQDNPTNTGTGSTSGEVNGGVVTEDLYDSNGYLKDSLPATYDFAADFNIYTWEEVKNWEWVDKDAEVEGTVMQALVERQMAVEERFGITIKQVYSAGSWGKHNDFIATLANTVQSNLHTYDMVGQYTLSAGVGAMQGLYMDLNDVLWLDLEKPWWPSSISETATIGSKLYFTTGDITPTLMRNVQCMFVNTDLYNSLELAELAGNRSIYDVVRQQDWTMEMMATLGIGTIGNEEGKYGISFLNNVAADAFFYGAGFNLLENIDGVLLASEDLSSVTLNDYYDTMKDLFVGEYADVAIAGNKPFIEKKAIFYAGSIADSQKFTEEGLHFSILPQPKRDKAQENYYTCANFWVTMYSVPVDAKNSEMSGMVMEGLASESYRDLSDEIYFNVFQARYNADGEKDSADMFDIVSDSVVFDSARFFGEELGMYASFRNGVSNTKDPEGSWAGIYGQNEGVWEEKIANIYGKVS